MKKLITIIFVLASTLGFCQVPTTGLINNWMFSGNANDNIGANNGTVFNATLTADRFGNPNCAYKFNGFSSYIKMTSTGPSGALPRSVSFWGKSNNTSLTAAFAYSGSDAFAIQFNYGCLGVGFDNSSGAYIMSNPNVSDGNWHHYVAVFDPAISTQIADIKFYMDGVLLTTLACTIGSTVAPVNTATNFPINIGKVADNNIRYYNGDLDDFFLYNRALTPAEVLALFNDTPCLATPPSPGSISGNITVCQGASVVYSVAPVAGATSYTWNLPGGWTGTSTTNTILATAGVNSGQITVASGNCCGASQPVTQDVTVNPAPSVSVTATQFTVCNGNSTTLFGNGASTYTWNSFVVAPSLAVSPSSNTTYTLSGTNSFGCVNTTTAAVIVTNNPLPTILLNGSGTSCVGQTVNIAANGASTYTWQPGGLNGFFVSVSPTVTTVYTVTGTDANGCYNSATYTQSVSTCAGINEAGNKNTEIIISPNPNAGSFIVSNKNIKPGTQLEIYNSIGQSVFVKMLEKDEEKVETKLSSGIYYVIIKENQALKQVQKIIIEQ